MGLLIDTFPPEGDEILGERESIGWTESTEDEVIDQCITWIAWSNAVGHADSYESVGDFKKTWWLEANRKHSFRIMDIFQLFYQSPKYMRWLRRQASLGSSESVVAHILLRLQKDDFDLFCTEIEAETGVSIDTTKLDLDLDRNPETFLSEEDYQHLIYVHAPMPQYRRSQVIADIRRKIGFVDSDAFTEWGLWESEGWE